VPADVRVPELFASDAPIDHAQTFDSQSQPGGCSALAALADRGILTTLRTKQVTFAPDRGWVVLRVRQPAPPGVGYPDQLVRVALPSGELTTISNAGGTAEALGQGGGLLVAGADADGKGLAVYEDGRLRVLASGACAHQATPDGSRVYALLDCDTRSRGTLAVIDVGTGTTTPVFGNVSSADVAVSPNSHWVAFIVQHSDAGTTTDTLHVADAMGSTYALPSQPGASNPWFASDELLLFAVGDSFSPSSSSELRGHVPGTGDTSYSITMGKATGLFGYKISADGDWLLGAAAPASDSGINLTAQLYAIRLDGSEEVLLSSDLVAFWYYQMPVDAFSFTGDGKHAVFIGGRLAKVWASDVLGTQSSLISNSGSFAVAGTGDQVALVEDSSSVRGGRLRIVALDTDRTVSLFESDAPLTAPNFPRDARGVIFVRRPTTGPSDLRYMSPSRPESLVLGEWSDTLLDMRPGPYASPLGKYPVDPTGCFTIIDTDLAPGPGTRLVLLPEADTPDGG